MNASAIAGVEHVDVCANLNDHLPDGGGHEPAALLVAIGVVGPSNDVVELVGEVEPHGETAEVEHVVGKCGGTMV
jgi:hypothetical protein